MQRVESVLIEPEYITFQRLEIMASNGVNLVEPLTPFSILVSNFSAKEFNAPEGIVLATALPHPKMVIFSTIQLAEVLGMEPQYTAPVIMKDAASSTFGSSIPTTNSVDKGGLTSDSEGLPSDTSIMSDALLSFIQSRVSLEKERNMEQLMQQTLNKDDSEKSTLDDAKLKHSSEEHGTRIRALLSKFPAM